MLMFADVQTAMSIILQDMSLRTDDHDTNTYTYYLYYLLNIQYRYKYRYNTGICINKHYILQQFSTEIEFAEFRFYSQTIQKYIQT